MNERTLNERQLNERTGTALINGRPLRYRVRRSRRARRLGVQVCRREGVVVTLPWRAGLKEVPRLLEAWGDWLDRKADEYGVRLGPVLKAYASGSELPVFGRPRRLEVGPLPAGRKRARIVLADDVLRMEVPPQDVWDLRPVLERWLRGLARRDLPLRVERWSNLIGPEPARVIIGERTSRWGSCSARGTISLCYRLVMAPPEVIDAVIAHEVCHLVHLNHSRRFYSLLDAACPGHRDEMDWLREHEDELIL